MPIIRNGGTLKPFTEMTPEEHRALSSKGGKKARENDKIKKTFKEALEWALDLPALKSDDEELKRLKKKYPKMTNRDAMVIRMVRETIQEGNVRAFVAVRDTTGELPEQTVNVKNDQPMVITVKTVE